VIRNLPERLVDHHSPVTCNCTVGMCMYVAVQLNQKNRNAIYTLKFEWKLCSWSCSNRDEKLYLVGVPCVPSENLGDLFLPIYIIIWSYLAATCNNYPGQVCLCVCVCVPPL
jgi:hypothetical protein